MVYTQRSVVLLENAVKKVHEPIVGQPFADILNELHEHAFAGVPGESDPFTLHILEREYISFALALYYQCAHCQSYHGAMIAKIREEMGLQKWDWREEIAKMILFLCIEKKSVSESVWNVWQKSWRKFAERIERHYSGLACHTAYAIGIARNDTNLMDMAFESINTRNRGSERIAGIIRDIDRVVVFMKAATSKNRTDPIIRKHLISCLGTSPSAQ